MKFDKKAYYLKNREKALAYGKAYREKHRERIRAQKQANKAWIKKVRHRYNKLNKENNSKYNRAYRQRPEVKKRANERRRNNPMVKRRNYLRKKVRMSVVRQKSYVSTIHKLIGCDVPTARSHLEAQFEPWMNWENYGCGNGKWCIDHIKRVNSIDIFDEDEVKRIFHYTNMRPLCFIKNCEDEDLDRPSI
jgi:hypothetical protein